MVWHKPASHYKEQRVHSAIYATHKEGAIHNIRSSDKPYSHLDGIINRHTIQFSATKKIKVRFKTGTIKNEKSVYWLHCKTTP